MKHCGLESCARMGVRFFALAGIVTALVEPVYKLFLHLYSHLDRGTAVGRHPADHSHHLYPAGVCLSAGGMDGQAGGSPMKRLGKFARIGAIVFAALGILTLLADRLFKRWLLHKALATAAPELIHSGEAASIGIIGGADGPTAIFITSIPTQWWMQPVVIAGLFAALAAACLAVWLLLRRRNDGR